jgi:uncharacterized protein YqgV (UPF0045/DUF77 family)
MSDETLNVIITAAIGILAPLAGWAVKKIMNYFDAKTKFMDGAHQIQQKEAIKNEIAETVETVVRATSQTYVKALRAAKDPSSDGGTKLTDAEKKDAFGKTKDKVVEILRARGVEYVNAALDTDIEAVVGRLKALKNLSGGAAEALPSA